MILLDTNVISELMREVPDDAVRQWTAGVAEDHAYTTAIAQAEILYGVRRLPPGRRRDALERSALDIFGSVLAGRVLPFDTAAASAFADILGARHGRGRPMDAYDAMIAAIARANAAVLATRNTRDFAHCGIDVVNPWGG